MEDRTENLAPSDLAQRLGGRAKSASWPTELNSVVAEVVERTREQGRVDKAAIMNRFPSLSQNQYVLLRDAIPQCFRDLKCGSRGRGGWVLKVKSNFVGASDQVDPIEVSLDDQLDGPQSIVANRLAELLSYEELRHLVGIPALNSLRSLVKAVHQREPSLSKRSLAAALLLRDGQELLSHQNIREALCKRAGVEPVMRWHAGKGSALSLVRILGLPESYAGTSAARAPDDVEYVQGHFGLPPLADFQQKVKTDVEEVLRHGQRCILTMPTGAGKTRTAVEYMRDYARSMGDGCILWVAHTAELLEQAVEAVRQLWSNSTGIPELRIDRRFGNHGRGDQADAEFLAAPSLGTQMVIATPARLINDMDRWRQEAIPAWPSWRKQVKLVLIDEAHRAAAPQYQRLMEEFGDDHASAKVLGLTATPFRNEYLKGYPELGTRELYKLFRKMARISDSEDPRLMLQQRGILSTPREVLIETGSKLTIQEPNGDSSIEAIERIDRRLAEDADTTARRTLVFRNLLPVCVIPTNRVIYFGPTVHDAEIMAFMLRASGIAAGFVSGATRGSERRRTIAEFKSGRLRVLCNCEVLTTGFDAPQTSHVVIARPTVSHVLFEQMVGRGLRGPQFGGTPECVVMHFVDEIATEGPRLGFRAWRKIWGLEEETPIDEGLS